MKKNNIYGKILCLLFFICITTPVKAEIETVTIAWTAQLCESGCQQRLEKTLGQVKGVSHVEINGPQGIATLTWSPNVRFSYMPVDYAMRMVGPSIRDIRVKVRGTITNHGKTFTLNSSGDNTSFELLGVPVPQMGNDTVVNNSLYTRQLDPATINQLTEIEKNSQTVTIEGPLFEPWRSPTLRIALQNINIENSSSPNSSS